MNKLAIKGIRNGFITYVLITSLIGSILFTFVNFSSSSAHGITNLGSHPWVSNGEEVWNFHDDMSSHTWELIDFSDEFFYETFGNGLIGTVHVIQAPFYSGTNQNGAPVTQLGYSFGYYQYLYVWVPESLSSNYLTGQYGPHGDKIVLRNMGWGTSPVSGLFYDVWNTSSFDLNTITWNNQPGPDTLLVENYNFYENQVYQYLNVGVSDQRFFVLTPSTTINPVNMNHASEEYGVYKPSIQKEWGKFHQGNGYAYMQTNVNELLKMQSQVYAQNYSLLENDGFVLDFQANTSSQMTIDLLQSGIVQMSIEVVPNGNTNFERQTKLITVSSSVDFDQLQFSGSMNDQDYFICHDIMAQCAPDTPSDPSPMDGVTGLNYSPILSVQVSDRNEDTMNVSFYDASDDSLIGTDFGVLNGGIASVTWYGLDVGYVYQWYAVASDRVINTISSIWTFTTNYAPNTPSNPVPLDGSVGLGYNPTLSVDVSDADGDILNVYFYDSVDDTLIGSNLGVVSGTSASIIWHGLTESTVYTWYVIVDDTLANTTSFAWSFTTSGTLPTWDEVPTNQVSEYGAPFAYEVNALDDTGIDYYWINDTTHFLADTNGVISNASLLSIGEYSVEIRAYDLFSNFCTATILVIIQDTLTPTWDEVPENQTIESGETFIYDVNASDVSGIEYYWINDTTNFEIDEMGTMLSLDILTIGEYSVEIRAYDLSGNYCSVVILVEVIEPDKDIPGFNLIVTIGVIAVFVIVAWWKYPRKTNKYI